MKKLAVFVHYSRDGKVCENAMLYAKSLTQFFDQVIISSNIPIHTDLPNTVTLYFEKNGYDFGYFYQAIEFVNAYENYDVIGMFNDSNYVIRPLDRHLSWCMRCDLDFCGITDSREYLPRLIKQYPDQHHIQSHFLIFKNTAIKKLKEYFKSFDVEYEIFNQTDVHTKRLNTIIYFEILLSVYMRKHGIKMGAYYSADEFIKKVSTVQPGANMHMVLWKELIDYDYPLIKRKLVNQNFPPDDLAYLKSIKEMTDMSQVIPYIMRYGDTNYIKTIKI